nr:hypothetical protein Iba_chr02fCG3940 [Ipomoea batatas]
MNPPLGLSIHPTWRSKKLRTRSEAEGNQTSLQKGIMKSLTESDPLEPTDYPQVYEPMQYHPASPSAPRASKSGFTLMSFSRNAGESDSNSISSWQSRMMIPHASIHKLNPIFLAGHQESYRAHPRSGQVGFQAASVLLLRSRDWPNGREGLSEAACKLHPTDGPIKQFIVAAVDLNRFC